jgi:hypothetical protein
MTADFAICVEFFILFSIKLFILYKKETKFIEFYIKKLKTLYLRVCYATSYTFLSEAEKLKNTYCHAPRIATEKSCGKG